MCETRSVVAAGRLSVIPALLWAPWELPHCEGSLVLPHLELVPVGCSPAIVQKMALQPVSGSMRGFVP